MKNESFAFALKQSEAFVHTVVTCKTSLRPKNKAAMNKL